MSDLIIAETAIFFGAKGKKMSPFKVITTRKNISRPITVP